MMRKSSFLTFCFALIPGAGHMYLGQMKKGISIMTWFWGIIAILSFLRLEVFAFFLPVIWFYAFFDTFNVRNLSEERCKEEDKYFFNADKLFNGSFDSLFVRRHKLFGGILVLIGTYLLYDNFISNYIYNLVSDNQYLSNLIENIPTLVVAFVIISLGIYLIRGKKSSNVKLIEQKDDFKEFGGEKDE